MKASLDSSPQVVRGELEHASWSLLGQQLVSGHGFVPDSLQPERISRLAGAMASMIQWLSQTIPVDLVVYWNPQQRKSHLVYNSPVADKELLDGIVKRLCGGALPRIRHWRQQDWFFHLWMAPPLEPWERLLIVEQSGLLSSEECNLLIQEALKNFYADLHAAMVADSGAGGF